MGSWCSRMRFTWCPRQISSKSCMRRNRDTTSAPNVKLTRICRDENGWNPLWRCGHFSYYHVNYYLTVTRSHLFRPVVILWAMAYPGMMRSCDCWSDILACSRRNGFRSVLKFRFGHLHCHKMRLQSSSEKNSRDSDGKSIAITAQIAIFFSLHIF